MFGAGNACVKIQSRVTSFGTIVISRLEYVQESKGCMDRLLKGCFLLSNLINYNYFLTKSICTNTSPCYQGPQCFLSVKRFWLTFKVVHVHESISYVILYLFAYYICFLHLSSACNFI